MWSRLLSFIRGSLTSSDMPSESEEAREFFQSRLAFFARLGTIVIGAGFVYRALAALLLQGYGAAGLYRNPTYWGHFLAVLFQAAVWRLAARGRRGAGALWALDIALTAGMCTLAGLVFWIAEPFETLPDKALLVGTNALVFRAIFLPSPAGWTLLLGCVSAVPVVVFGGLTLRRWTAVIPGYNPALEAAFFAQWMMIAVAVSTVTSAVIYRLRRRVHEARKLGQYTLEEKLGEGGMGVVYRARHALLRRPTAVKLLKSTGAGDAGVARFEREVQLTSLLTHPNTIAIYDYGRTPDGIFYYAMEYLEGVDLERLVRDGGPVPPSRAVHIVEQVASSLAEAHEAGLIHRDIKPANILLCARGGAFDVAKVLDFGLVKSLVSADATSTSVQTIAGTPHFMAPEAIRDPLNVDARSDLYALGAVAYYLVSGQRPFDGRTAMDVLSQHLNDQPLSPSAKLGRPLPAGLEALILRCLAKDAAARPASARELISQLEAFAGDGRWTQMHAAAWWAEHRARAATAAAAAPTADVPAPAGALLKTITVAATGR